MSRFGGVLDVRIRHVAHEPQPRSAGDSDQISRRRPWRTVTLFWQVVWVLVLGVVLTGSITVLLGLVMGLSWDVPSAGQVSPGPGWIEAAQLGLATAAGLGGAVAIVVNYRKQRVLEDQHAQAQVASARDELTSATQQLGSDAPATRLAGVYALINLAETNPERAQEYVDVLCGYLRFPWPLADQPVTHAANRAELEVRITALRLIGEHLRPTDLQDLNDARTSVGGASLGGIPHPSVYRKPGLASWSELSFDLTQAHLPRFDWDCRIVKGELDFTASTFAELAAFSRVVFARHAHFDGATFEEEARFTGAVFADLGFDRCTFNGEASFALATFIGQAWFQSSAFGRKASFGSATFTQDCNFADTEFSGEAHFDHTKFSSVRHDETAGFEAATFRSGAWFSKSHFYGGANFTSAEFAGSARFDEVVASRPLTFRLLKARATRELASRGTTVGSSQMTFTGATIQQGLDLGAAEIQCPTDWTDAVITGKVDTIFGVGAEVRSVPTVAGATLNGAARVCCTIR